ncbi:hypothetical protein M427DRAFT_52729 [Gonapodya prolifera JEL478]|uniref:Chromo domain-containing protein n=1 Tax=Gonapodya prolifera (strain JEL478) TaxID=1344416 RepID=A0A139ATK2_GONPJ|nr:hypothetical protein M427DRAFT_52729 [Gonapodya prolifera JEL478]|eukprot:KXS19893.1 hypothetical protein M427DRAFT_52729 [Gonapodya prolifera JEL478]
MSRRRIRDDDEDDENVDLGDEADEYVIKEIRDERHSGSNIEFLVEWEGYPVESEWTWEPASKLKGMDVLREWRRKTGPKPVRKKQAARNNSQPRAIEDDSDEFRTAGQAGPAGPSGPSGPQNRAVGKSRNVKRRVTHGAQSDDQERWPPSPSNWDDKAEVVDIFRDSQTKQIVAQVRWLSNGRKFCVDVELTYQCCPQATLRWYHAHLQNM